MAKMSRPTKTLIIGLVMILLGSVFASMLQTNFYSVRVKDLSLQTQRQGTSHSLMFIPKECTAENPCPVIITSHGWLNSAEVQDAASIELSRRGMVVIAMDATGHGMSSNGIGIARDQDAMGMIPLVEYVTSGILDYVDTDRVGVMGHSMGGSNAWYTLRYYGNLYFNAIAEAQDPESDGGEEITAEEQAYADSLNKVWAGLPTGTSPSAITDERNIYAEIHANLGVLYGFYEEGGYSTSTGTANLLGESAEAFSLINFPNGVEREAPISYVEEGVFYGNKEDRTLRVLYQPKTTHPLIHFMPNATRDVIEFFTYVNDTSTTLAPTNQLFLIKEIMNFVAMIGLFVIMVPLAQLLMDCPVFAELKGEEGPKVPALDKKSKKSWVLGILLTGAMSFGTALLAWLIYDKIFTIDYSAPGGQFWFPIPTANVVMTWTALMALWSMFWFWFNFKRDKAKGLRTDEMIGWKITKKEFWKTLGLATLIIAVVYSIVWFCKWLFNTDFRIWTPAIKTFNPDKLLYFFQYWPVFFAFYLANSLTINGAMRVEGMKEGKNLFLLGIANIIGPGLVVLFQYGKLFTTGTVLWGAQEWVGWIDVLVIGFTVFLLFPAPYILRAFYKATGKNWLGPIVYSVMAVMTLVMHNAIYGLFF